MVEEKSKQEIEEIYPEDIKLGDIKEKPILKPILEIKRSYHDFELSISRALYEFEELQKKIDEMIEENPIYSMTQFGANIKSLLSHAGYVVHCQDIQKMDVKNAISEMVKISETEYVTLAERDEIEKRKKQYEEKIKANEKKNKDSNKSKEGGFYSKVLGRQVEK